MQDPEVNEASFVLAGEDLNVEVKVLIETGKKFRLVRGFSDGGGGDKMAMGGWDPVEEEDFLKFN